TLAILVERDVFQAADSRQRKNDGVDAIVVGLLGPQRRVGGRFHQGRLRGQHFEREGNAAAIGEVGILGAKAQGQISAAGVVVEELRGKRVAGNELGGSLRIPPRQSCAKGGEFAICQV